ncbi:hypothetical protein C8Q78DRAFT_645043 [Trametes maxima]|nr:hypothetical protein C8Q78DRAFT_645043 [Trametes maxima]
MLTSFLWTARGPWACCWRAADVLRARFWRCSADRQRRTLDRRRAKGEGAGGDSRLPSVIAQTDGFRIRRTSTRSCQPHRIVRIAVYGRTRRARERRAWWAVGARRSHPDSGVAEGRNGSCIISNRRLRERALGAVDVTCAGGVTRGSAWEGSRCAGKKAGRSSTSKACTVGRKWQGLVLESGMSRLATESQRLMCREGDREDEMGWVEHTVSTNIMRRRLIRL